MSMENNFYIENQANFDKYRNHEFKPGDTIFFRRGVTYQGQFNPTGSGKKNAPIQVKAFGEGDTLPVINGSETDIGVFNLLNADYWHIFDLEITGGTVFGFNANITDTSRIYHQIYLDNVVVHDMAGMVNGSNGAAGTAGIRVNITDRAMLRDVKITNCKAYDLNWWAGIAVGGSSSSHDGNWSEETIWRYDAIVNIEIKNCHVYNTMGNGITTGCCTNSLIEDCLAHDCGQYELQDVYQTPVGIWSVYARNAVIRRCEVYGQKTYSTIGDGDGGAFDIDYSCENFLIEHCYGHDNHGAGVLLCAVDWGWNQNVTRNSIIRHNIFANNANNARNTECDIYVHQWGTGTNAYFDGVQIYNNTFYWNPANKEIPCVRSNGEIENTVRGSLPNVFANNIIYSTVPYLVDLPDNFQIDNNLYYYTGDSSDAYWTYDNQKLHWEDVVKVEPNSLMMDPNVAGDFKQSNRFKLSSTSPAIGKGKMVLDIGDTDYYGNEIKPAGPWSIGADNGNL